MSTDQVRERAEEFVKKYQVKKLSLDRIKAIIESQGYTIIEYDRAYNSEDINTIVDALGLTEMIAKSKGFTYADRKYRLVFVNESLSEDEKILVLLHEEGHIYLEHFRQAAVIGEDVTDEHEANEFSHYVLNKDYKKNFLEIIKGSRKAVAAIVALLIAAGISAAGIKGIFNGKQLKSNDKEGTTVARTESTAKTLISDNSAIETDHKKDDASNITKSASADPVPLGESSVRIGDRSTKQAESIDPAENQNAVARAKAYLNNSAFSYTGLIEQLEFEKYSHDEAVYAADNCGADWKKEAVLKAKQYMKTSSFSKDGLIEQLEYEGFTHEQAEYGSEYYVKSASEDVVNPGVSAGKSNALAKAKSYLGISAFSYTGLIKQLEFEKFAHDDAVYAADNCGADWNEEAAKKAKRYLSISSFSKDRLIEQLEYDGFSSEQAAYGTNAAGL